jgi:hypothetical protein
MSPASTAPQARCQSVSTGSSYKNYESTGCLLVLFTVETDTGQPVLLSPPVTASTGSASFLLNSRPTPSRVNRLFHLCLDCRATSASSASSASRHAGHVNRPAGVAARAITSLPSGQPVPAKSRRLDAAAPSPSSVNRLSSATAPSAAGLVLQPPKARLYGPSRPRLRTGGGKR